jgi:hypothetical protein
MTTLDGWRHVSRLRGAGAASAAGRRYATRSRRSQTGSALITTMVVHDPPVLITTHRASSRRWRPNLPSTSVRIPAPAANELRQFPTDSIAAIGVVLEASALAELGGPFKLDRAPVDGAVGLATSCAHPPSPDTLRWAARQQVRYGVDELERRTSPGHRCGALVHPPPARPQLQGFAASVRAFSSIRDDWGFRLLRWCVVGLAAPCAGLSGTVTTLAARTRPIDLDPEPNVIDLTVIEAHRRDREQSPGDLRRRASQLCDPVRRQGRCLDSPSLGGARRARPLRQHRGRLPAPAHWGYDGTAILAANLKANLDRGSAWRFHSAVEFTLPDAAQRRPLWARGIPDGAPRDELDVAFLARQFELADEQATVTSMAAVETRHGETHRDGAPRHHIAGEYVKLGRTTSETEFARWYPLAISRPRGEAA